ncbi:uncharacterized protein [Argopecten irradians]|uniref:uncharacterized protein n=1 Tax=Argopecten irradians TaxID=31199 RepID=UPI003723E351
MPNCIIITAIVCVLITTVATIVSFSLPNWLHFRNLGDALCGCSSKDCHCGLWINCRGGFDASSSLANCEWFFSDDFHIEKSLPDWFKAVQGLMSCAVASSMLSLLIGLFSLCWTCKGCNPHQATGAFANLTFLLLAVAVCVFGTKAYLDKQAIVMESQTTSTEMLLFGWSFWVAVGATGMALISSILYFCVGRSDDTY